jgi:hypothetical protein
MLLNLPDGNSLGILNTLKLESVLAESNKESEGLNCKVVIGKV